MSAPPTSSGSRAALAALLTLSLGVSALLGYWIRGALLRRVPLDRLSPDDRQHLVTEALRESPATFQPAWFAPRIGYTLRPKARISAWDDSFGSNVLGYRAPPPQKPAGTYRIVFLGDSWTYGMGIKGEESFPAQLAELANRRLPRDRARIQAWPLALPGYNTFNEIAALELFFDRLQPDAVVLCPTHNDIDSSGSVTPEGLLVRSHANPDDFGDPHSQRLLMPLVDSAGFYRRWHQVGAAAAGLERDLERRKIPFFIFFAATWSDTQAHALVAESGLRAPYAITPAALTLGKWRNPPPFRHGTAAANVRYARLVYQLLAAPLGWPALGTESGSSPPESARVFRSPLPGGTAAVALRRETASASTRLPTRYEPGPEAEEQCLAAMDCATGLAPLASTYLLRRQGGGTEIEVTLERLAAPTWLYPLEIEARVADERETLRTTLILRADGPAVARFQLPIPRGSASVLEVTLLAAHASAHSTTLQAESFWVRTIEQR